MPLSIAWAVECIERGFAKATELGFKVAVAVVDDAGHLVASHRMDGALWVTPDIARAKANAAAAFRASTADLEERFSGARHLFASNVATLGDHRFVFGRGAVPLMQNGHHRRSGRRQRCRACRQRPADCRSGRRASNGSQGPLTG